LAPVPGEIVLDKRYFSAFESGRLASELARLGCDTLWIAGVHLHGCVRVTALDAYRHGLAVRVVDDAVASDDPVHAAITRRYLDARGIRWATAADLLADRLPPDGADVAGVVAVAAQAWTDWRRRPLPRRIEAAARLADLLAGQADHLARGIAEEIGKPLRYARAEVERSAEIVRSAARWAAEPEQGRCGRQSIYRDRPLGVIAAITPWNNPVAIALGKLVPALLFGNAVVWKPAPAASGIAQRLTELLAEAGIPPEVAPVVPGGAATAAALMGQPQVAAVSLTGSESTGRVAQEICSRRCVPLQAELGGNNAAIVWPDCDLALAARRIAEAAFGFAGQRCTANRRVVVADACRADFLRQLRRAVDDLAWGDPLDEATVIGPLVSSAAARRIAAVVARSGAELLFGPRDAGPRGPAFHPPMVLARDDPSSEIVQEESFGPVLVVQGARDFEDALALCNGVRQGLVSALHSRSSKLRERFLEGAQAGILKLGSGTADADAEAPFGGWKASGVGPAEHGRWDRAFFTRPQAVYREEG
ncbi:MAG: aldehyde dehydrogenase family protein, partial [Deltaproteobacteria bacterium]|nr:aldehyde dehydrogenase family protein [Deltaproteobacteria bacterium]